MTTIRAEFLEIDGFSLSTHAWETLDLSPLWTRGRKRGGDRRIPKVDGARAYPRRYDVTVRPLKMVIVGHVDEDGVPYLDAREGLDTNVEAIQAAIVDPPVALDGTRTALLHRPLGTTTGPVHVLGLELGILGPAGLNAVLELSLPEGHLV